MVQNEKFGSEDRGCMTHNLHLLNLLCHKGIEGQNCRLCCLHFYIEFFCTKSARKLSNALPSSISTRVVSYQQNLKFEQFYHEI
jgi:hypothetical protein